MGDKYIIGKIIFNESKVEGIIDPYIEALEYIAYYPDPDFPADDCEDETRRYYNIICELREAARVALS